MSSQASVYRRIVRRELHSSRAGWAITTAVVLALLAAAAGVASVYLIAHEPVWVGVEAGFGGLAGLHGVLRYPVAAAGVAALAVGAILVAVAVTPGRRPRRVLQSARAAVVVDDKVVARALAKAAAAATGLPRDQVEVVMGRSRAKVTLASIAGVAVDRGAVARAVVGAGAPYGLRRAPRILVSPRAVVG